MTFRGLVLGALALLGIAPVPAAAQAQHGKGLRPTHADSLLADGRWAEAEAAFYQQSEVAPRDPVARAALGQFIAMKGAIRPGLVLIAEARKFGLDRRTATELAAPWTAILEWRAEAALLRTDSTLDVRAPNDAHSLFQVALPRTDEEGRPWNATGARQVIWYDVVDRQVGLDSLNAQSRPIGIEVFEALAPSLDVRNNELTLHANLRAALTATGRRFQVLRTAHGVRVLIGEQRVLPLAAALRELKPRWWQVDLPHGLLVIR